MEASLKPIKVKLSREKPSIEKRALSLKVLVLKNKMQTETKFLSFWRVNLMNNIATELLQKK